MSDPEFRRDPVCGRWTIVAPERSQRPQTLENAAPRHRPDGERQPCPFCPGHEAETLHELLAYRGPESVPDGPGWQLRVVPNKFPAVKDDMGLASTSPGDALFFAGPGFGRAEVLIECPEHFTDSTHLSDFQFAAVFRAYRDRILALAADERLRYAAVFKNAGAEAGASLGHTHSQIISLPIVPELVRSEWAGSADYHSRTGRCVFCDVLRAEAASRERFVTESERFAIVTAFAPRFDYEFWVLPLEHSARYETIDDAACLDLARLMKRTLLALDKVAGEPAYNWCLHTSPLRSGEAPHYHWHLEVMPRMARPAGLEWGFGGLVATAAPELTASELRGAMAVSHSAQHPLREEEGAR